MGNREEWEMTMHDDEPAHLFTEHEPYRFGIPDRADRRAIREAQKAIEPKPPVLAAAIVLAGAASVGFIAGLLFTYLVS